MIFMEIALLVAPTGKTIDTCHFWSEENHVADLLSRAFEEDFKAPYEIAGMKPSKVDLRKLRILGATEAPPRRPKRARGD